MRESHNHWIWIFLALSWTVVITVFAWQESSRNRNDTIALASVEARASFNKDLVYRRWATNHGGVYVPVTEETQPNQYLKNVFERDLKTPSGRNLTLVNPAYMTRQVHELAEDQYGVKGHITSLTPLRPENKPDSWEAEALKSFERGAEFAKEEVLLNGESSLRMMFPMAVEEGCLKCHEEQGYSLGGIRGGVSVSVPLGPYLSIYQTTLPRQISYHFGLWLLGSIALFCTRLKVNKQSLDLASTLEHSIKAGHALRESQERYKSLVENTEDLVTRVDHEGHLIYVNSSSLKYWGLPPEDCIGKFAFDFICPDDRETTASHFQTWLISNSRYITFDNRQLHVSGQTTDMHWMVVPLYDDNGKVYEINGIGRDVSERVNSEKALQLSVQEYREAEKRLKESEGRFKALHDASFDGVIIHDQGLILDCNQGLSDITGFSAEELIGMDGLKLIAPGSLDLVLRHIKTGYADRYEVEGMRKDGSAYPLSIKGKNVIYKGRDVRVIEFRDISERKRAEERLLYNQSLLEKAQELGHIGTWELELSNNRLVWTDENCRIFGVPTGSIVDFETFFAKIHPEDRKLVNEAWQAALHGEPYDIEHRIIVAEAIKWVREKADLEFDKEGNALKAVGFTQDITNRKQLEETLRQKEFFFEETQRAARIGSYRSDFVKDTWATSEVLDQIFGMNENYNKSIQGWSELIHPDDREEMKRYAQDVIGRNVPFNKEYRIIRHTDGETRWVLGLGETIVDDSGDVVGLIGTIQDITEQKGLEQQLLQAKKMEAIGTLSGGIAHDFNNLLAIMTSNLDSMRNKRNAGTSDEENLEHVNQAVLRAQSLVKQILSFSRQEKSALKPVDFTKVIDESLRLMRSTLPTTIEILSKIDCSQVSIKADITQLQQVLINLCTNASHAMNEKGVLTISLGTEDVSSKKLSEGNNHQAGVYARLTISDTGKGMSKETIDRAFDPFFTTKVVGSGTGMGLSIVHGIVEQHGGFVTVESTPGVGTSFKVYFPAIVIAQTEVEAVQESTLPVGSERILFVDDEECIAETCGELLEHQGYKVTNVTSSLEALEIFKANPGAFDLVFTDQTMPKMTGVQLASELLKVRPDIPIILCSGYSAKVSEDEALGVGIHEFCMKPMDMKQLAIVARRVLDK